MAEHVNTLIIGAGQAGLALSACLARQGREHLILDQAERPLSAWRARWDSFTLVTPNWQIRLPELTYSGPDPDGFLRRDELLALLDDYAARLRPPLRCGTRVLAVEPAGAGYRVSTDQGELQAANVVVATGMYQTPRRPACADALPHGLLSLHSHDYRSPAGLPPGPVLVVGSGQSGAQIAEELYQSGRQVYLCVGRAGRVPRRYRGQDITAWEDRLGTYDRTPAQLDSPRAKFAARAHLTGKDGGHTLNLHQFARDGVVLLGSLRGLDGGALALADDLHANLRHADQVEAELVRKIDRHLFWSFKRAPKERLPQLRDGFGVPQRDRLDLAQAGVRSVIWATGYSFDYRMVKLPVLDQDGFPIQERGATRFPGLYFLGMPWLSCYKSGLLYGVGADAEAVAAHIQSSERQRGAPAALSGVPAPR